MDSKPFLIVRFHRNLFSKDCVTCITLVKLHRARLDRLFTKVHFKNEHFQNTILKTTNKHLVKM